LWRLLRRERPAIVHTHTAMAGCLGRLAAVLSGVPIVIHTFHGNSLNAYFSRIQSGVFRRIEQLLAHFTDALCVVSPQQATELSAKFRVAPAHKFRVVPLGLELDDYFALRPPAGNGPLTVGWFGRMVPVKNVALLAATIEKALQRSPDMRFVIAGDGPDSSALQGVIERHGGCVEWLGWQMGDPAGHGALRCSVADFAQRRHAGGAYPGHGGGAALCLDRRGWRGGHGFGQRRALDGRRALVRQRRADGFRCRRLAGALAALAENRTLVSRMGLAGRDFASRQHRKETLVGNVDALYRDLLWKKNLGPAVSRRNS
jgi:glycosyltransferase involved in cell wall biosynthesis